MINDWLYYKCDNLGKLKSSRNIYDFKIKEALDWCVNNENWRPISLNRLNAEHPELYRAISTCGSGEGGDSI